MHTQTPPIPPDDALPGIRTIALTQPLRWLVLAWRDMARCGWISWAHGVVLALVGAAIFFMARERFWLLAGALSGFLVIAPVLATSLYALSRALERGEKLYAKDCAVCHGNRGEGDAKKFMPLVAGQHYQYLLREMALIRDGKRGNANPDMVKVISAYGNDDLAAVADYISRLMNP